MAMSYRGGEDEVLGGSFRYLSGYGAVDGGEIHQGREGDSRTNISRSR
jgi:hypothetical protein